MRRLHLASQLNNGGSSLFRPTRYPLLTEEVQSLTLVDFLRNIGINRCDLMKVDIEGAEYEVFMNAEAVLKEGIIRRIALDIHYSILERRGKSGKELHECILKCGYTMNDSLGIAVYTFNG